MPSIGHLAVGLAAARIQRPPTRIRMAVWILLLVALSFLPDADVLAFRFGIPYGAPFGHRGAFHSLGFAAIVTGVLWGVARRLELPADRVALTGGAVLATHGLLDTLTDGGRGIALLWPFTNERYFAPWRPFAVAPIGLRILSPHGVSLMLHEAVWFLPFWVFAAWPRRRSPEGPSHARSAAQR